MEYRLLDLDVREVVGQFGALMSTNRNRSRVMNVSARIGDYKLDSSNFVSDDGFRGFIGPTGSVGIERDYDSLRQDLWIATDQAFKEAAYSRKQAYLSGLARASDIMTLRESGGAAHRTISDIRLEFAQLGTGSAGYFRSVAGISANLRLAGDVLPGVHDRISVDERRDRDADEPVLRGDRSGNEHAGKRRDAGESLLRHVCTETRGSAERRCGAENLNVAGRS